MDRVPDALQRLLACRALIEHIRGTKPAVADRLAARLAVVEDGLHIGAPGSAESLASFLDELSAVDTTLSGAPPPGGAVADARPEAAPPRGGPEMPASLDLVHFTVTGPPTVQPGASFIVEVWAHLGPQRSEVVRRAREATPGETIFIRERGAVQIARATTLTVRLEIEGLVVAHPEDTILWEGDIGCAGFAVRVPADARQGSRIGTVTLFVNSLQVARLDFRLLVAESSADSASTELGVSGTKRIRSAFASYDSRDKDEVLNVILGLEKGNPGLQVFFAEKELRSGERWQERLWEEIDRRDILYLFWSQAASESIWVEREWRCAYERRGVDFIDPVPLASPEVVRPPTELADELHFNHWVLAYKRRTQRV